MWANALWFPDQARRRCPCPPDSGTFAIAPAIATEILMRLRLLLFTLSFYLALSVLGCTSKPSSDGSTDTAAGTDAQDTTGKSGKESKERKEPKEAREGKERREPLVVRAGTAVTVSLGSAIGSKLSQSGQTFTGSV